MKRPYIIVLCLTLLLFAAHAEHMPEPAAEPVYRILIINMEDEAIQGAMLTLCDDTMCVPIFTDDTGCAYTSVDPAGYDIHVVNAPGGYEFDPDAAYRFDEGADTLTIVLERE